MESSCGLHIHPQLGLGLHQASPSCTGWPQQHWDQWQGDQACKGGTAIR